jgi:D-serine dehydratase
MSERAIMFKGVPHAAAALPFPEGVIGLRLTDDALMLPAAVLRRSALDHNRRWMHGFLAASGLSFAPHAKTTMSPELIRRQIEDGAWAITAATAHHVRLYAEWGVPRILMANQLVGRANIEAVLALLRERPALEFFCLVDSHAGVDQLAAGARAIGLDRPVQVLLELGSPGQRTGVRSPAAAHAVAAACAAAPDVLALRGFECFEGVHADPAAAEAMLSELLAAVAGLGELLASGEAIISAGGTYFFDLAAQAMQQAGTTRPLRRVLRSGCYITHDHLNYERSFIAAAARDPDLLQLGRPQPALEVWAHVQSRPEPTRVIASLGKRDVGNDVDLPVPVRVHRVGRDAAPRPASPDLRVVKLYDQHACLDVPADSDLAVGDLVGFGVSHPCTTFDKWRALFVVDDDDRVCDVVHTAF